MKQWDILSFEFQEGIHPVVVLSPDHQCFNPDFLELNILFASSARPISRPPKAFEVVLDEADGLDWKTFVRCHRIHLAKRTLLAQKRGSVSPLRQREICRKIAEVFTFRL